jgi:hypothetical protein
VSGTDQAISAKDFDEEDRALLFHALTKHIAWIEASLDPDRDAKQTRLLVLIGRLVVFG